MSESVVEQTYQALVSVVQTTAVTRKVLQRPPFTFLHKLLVETLAGYDLFTPTQLDFSALVSKEDKAAFLTRALAFVTFAMANAKEQCVSCLLLVSPVKVLAGVAVEDTLEFLLQLCVVCKSVDRDAKEAAAQEVTQKGDALLYKSSVSFRRGLILIQAVIRTFIRRRVGKRRAIEISARSQTGRLSMSVGARFLKELPQGRIYDGVIRSVQNNRYVLVYDQDPEAEDEVDEIEMKIILEESQRLAMYRDRISESGRRISKRNSKRSEDADISLTSLPDLSQGVTEASATVPIATLATNSRLLKRVSSRDSGIAILAPKQQSPVLMRALSQRPTKSNPASLIVSSSTDLASTIKRSESRSGSLGTKSSDTENPGASANSGLIPPTEKFTPEEDHQPVESIDGLPSDSKTWQSSLKKILDDGRQGEVVPSSKFICGNNDTAPETHQKVSHRKNKVFRTAREARNSETHLPSFPKLSIPGTKPLVASSSKRRSNETVPSGASTGVISSGLTNVAHSSAPETKAKSTATTVVRNSGSEAVQPAASTPEGSVTNTARFRSNSTVSLRGSNPEQPIDAVFTGTYQSTDQKTQEKLAFFREIVMHIDSYMKRKRLRVIDLFRFCDADGNGSISPQEMIDTLSQMEIQLTPEQGHEFINFIDKDGNGSIDIDEFEELVRVARRSEAQREMLRKEIHTSKRPVGEGKDPGRFAALARAKNRILDEFKSKQVADGESMSVAHARAVISGLGLPNVDDASIGTLIDRAVTVNPAGFANGKNSGASNATVTLQQLTKALDDLEWAKKTNRFLNQAWLSQFDAQMERAARDFELL